MDFKSKTMLVILMAVVFFFSTITALNGDEKANKALLGNWNIEADTGGQVLTFVFEFTMENDALKGKMTFDMGEGEMTDISFDGKKLIFSVSLDVNGQTIYVDADGEVEGDKMSGTLSADMGEASFSGEKEKKE